MKTYWDHSDRERSEMTEDQVRAFLDYELMALGVLKPKAPVLEAVEEVALPAKTFFRLKFNDWHDVNVLFVRLEDAMAVSEMQLARAENDYQAGREFGQPVSRCTVEKVELPGPESKDAARQALIVEKQRKDRNEKAQSEYAKACQAADKSCEGIWKDWYASREMADKYARIRDTMADYIKLTDGNAEMARTFLAKAFGEDDIRESEEWFAEGKAA